MAGLLAARVLSNHFGRVTVVERDPLPDGAGPRKGVPQGRHVHALLAGGKAVGKRLFPGLIEELLADGATSRDSAAYGRWYQPGGYRPQFESGIKGVSMSRPLLEGHVRRRVRALANVNVVEECSGTGLAATGDREKVIGVALPGRGDGRRRGIGRRLDLARNRRRAQSHGPLHRLRGRQHRSRPPEPAHGRVRG